MTTASDTNVLLDVLIADAPDATASRDALWSAAERGNLVICEAVYAELAAFLGSESTVDRFLREWSIDLTPSPVPALAIAGQRWRSYRSDKQDAAECASCGARQTVRCRNCRATMHRRQHILADFMIGGHAEAAGARLLTRDQRFFRRYFPALDLRAG